MTTRNDHVPDQAANAKVYIGSTLCGTLPGTLELAKDYPITCDATGDFVRINSKSSDYLGFAEVEVYQKSDLPMHGIDKSSSTHFKG